MITIMVALTHLLDGFHAGDLGALGDPDAKGVPKRQTVKGVRFRQKKIPEVTVVPHLVPQAAGISHSSFRRYLDYVIVSDTLEGLGTAAGSQSGAGKKQVEETAAGAGGPKRRRLQSKRTGPTSKKPAVTVGKCCLACLKCYVQPVF